MKTTRETYTVKTARTGSGKTETVEILVCGESGLYSARHADYGMSLEFSCPKQAVQDLLCASAREVIEFIDGDAN